MSDNYPKRKGSTVWIPTIILLILGGAIGTGLYLSTDDELAGPGLLPILVVLGIATVSIIIVVRILFIKPQDLKGAKSSKYNSK
jgi:L-asparagine transporter-like permease